MAGIVLIVVQIALTLAIVCNALFIVGQRIERMRRPSGVQEQGLIRISQTWLDAPDAGTPAGVDKLDAMQRADLEALRRLPGVIDVAASDSMPLQGAIWSGDLRRDANQKRAMGQAALYYGDDHMLPTLGLRLVAGRNFNPEEIDHHMLRSVQTPAVCIVSRAVADQLFPAGGALGKTIYVNRHPITIIGIVALLQTPTLAEWGRDWAYDSILMPVRLDGASASYALRVRPGREQAVMRAARDALFAIDPLRDMPDTWGLQTMREIRFKAYRGDRGTVIVLGIVCLILLMVTAAGIVGLTSFWVGQRRRQIGIRRALGARRLDILRHFQTENLFIAGIGAVLGVLLAVALNLWLMAHYEMPRIPPPYVFAGVLVMLAIGQASVFVPARRASKVPPVVATRAV
ncbi:FtsX-like permease family protein [Rhodanobacter sp. B04]|uniref:ABC transporter permease n=1 Tax=Rhodanobacter sp. B04 TaxID=1945860 RepID=UPI0031B642BD